jgi:hypothetical protein
MSSDIYIYMYIAQTGHSIDTRLKEHQQHTLLEQPEKSAMLEHSNNLRHHIQEHNTSILSTKPRYMMRNIRKATKVEYRSNNMNSEDGICPRKSWTPPICSSEVLRKPRPRFLELRSLQGHTLVGLYTLLLSQYQFCPLWPIISPKPPPCCSSFPPLLSLLNLQHMPRTYAHNFSPTLLGSLPTTPLPPLPHCFPDQYK